MHGHFGAIVHGSLDAGHSAVCVNDQFLSGGAQHNLVVLVSGHHGVVRHCEVSAPLAGVLNAVHNAADGGIFTLPQATDQGRLLAVVELRALSYQPLLDFLTALDELAHQVVTAVHPLGLVCVRTQAAVIGLEDVQVNGREQGQLGLVHAGIQLGLCPIQVSLNFLLQCLQGGQIFLVHAAGSVQSDIACHEGMIVIQGAVEGLLRPGQNGLQGVDTTCVVLHLVVGLTVQRVHARGSIGIVSIPHQIAHHRLEGPAGNQRVAAHFSVLLQNNNGVAVLSRLCSSGHASAAGTDNNHVIGLFDRLLSGVLHRVRLESVEVGAACLRRRIIHSIADCVAGEGRAGNNVNTRAVCRQDVRDDRLKGHIADMCGF